MSPVKNALSLVEVPFIETRSTLPEIQIESLDLSFISKNLSDTYNISVNDADAAVTALKFFFDLRNKKPSDIFLLPKVVDWAWHEFIIETESYSAFCYEFFGHYISHVVKVGPQKDYLIKEKIFDKTVRTIMQEYNFDMTIRGWCDPGWETHIELREPSYWKPKHNKQQQGCEPRSNLFDWIEGRLETRWEMSPEDARESLTRYLQFFHAGEGLALVAPEPCIDAAWREHILWTDQYESDCQKFFGRFWHRKSSLKILQ